MLASLLQYFSEGIVLLLNSESDDSHFFSRPEFSSKSRRRWANRSSGARAGGGADDCPTLGFL